MREIWRAIAIPEYNGLYEVSNMGRVRSHNGVLKPRAQNSGYLLLHLSSGGVRKAYTIHRLVALTFIPNPENKPQVNHRNGNKRDNRVCNLEWCTNSENQVHRLRVLGHPTYPSKNKKPVRCVETGQVFSSVTEAVQQCGVHRSNLIAVCKKYPNCHTIGGYHWEYV